MKKQEKIIENLTFNRIKKVGLNVPSADFTKNVMQYVILEKQPEDLVHHRINWWFLALIPVFAGLTWYAIIFFNLFEPVSHFYATLHIVIQHFIAGILFMINQFKNISISPLMLVSFAAILSLITIDEFANRIKHTS